jgi:hypothetical protein
MEINNVRIQPEVFGDAFDGCTCKEIIRLGAVSHAWSIFVKNRYDNLILLLLQLKPDDVFLNTERVVHMVDVLRSLAKRKKGSRYSKAFKDMLANPDLFNLTSFPAAFLDPKTSMEMWMRTFDVLQHRLYEVAVDSRQARQDKHVIATLETIVSITLIALFAHSPLLMRDGLNGYRRRWNFALDKDHRDHVCINELASAPLKKIYNAYKRKVIHNLSVSFEI